VVLCPARALLSPGLRLCRENAPDRRVIRGLRVTGWDVLDGQRALVFERFVQQRFDVGLIRQAFLIGRAFAAVRYRAPAVGSTNPAGFVKANAVLQVSSDIFSNAIIG